MAKRNGNGNGKERRRRQNEGKSSGYETFSNMAKRAKKPTAGRDMPLPRTLPSHLKPYDTNNDGVISKDERIAMLRAKQKEKLLEEMKKNKKEVGVRARKKTN